MKTFFKLITFYFIIGVIFFYPLSIKFATHIHDNFDSLFLLWTLAWWKHILATNPLNFLNSNALYPDTLTLAYSTFMYAKLPFFLVFEFFFNNILASYNLTIFSSIIISAVAMYYLAYYYSKNKFVSLLAGFLYAFSPIKMGRISLAQVLNLEYFPLCILFAEKYFRSKKRKDIIFLTFFSLMQILSEGYLAFIYAFGMAIFLVLRFRKRLFDKLFLAAILFQLLVSFVFYSPYIYLKITRPEVYKRELVMTMNLSNNFASFVSLPEDLFQKSILGKTLPFLPSHPDRTLYFGIVPLVFFFWSLRYWHERKKYLWLIIFLIYIILSFGPYYQLPGNQFIKLPYYYLYKFVPVFSVLRGPGRFSLGAVLPLVILASWGMAVAFKRLNNKILRLGLYLLIFVVLAADNLFLPFANEKIVQIPKIYYYLKTQPRGGVFEFPFRTERDFFIDKAMYFSTADFFPRVMAYSSNYSETFNYFKFLERVELLYTTQLTDKLISLKVPYVLVHKGKLKKDEYRRFVNLIKAAGYEHQQTVETNELYRQKKFI